MAFHQALGRAEQVPGASVIAESRPERKHTIHVAFGKAWKIWEASHETMKVIDHRGDLRLLEHDLRDPYSVGRARVLPRQMCSTMLVVPGKNG